MHVTPLHLDVAHHFRQTCAALTGAALFGTFSAAPRQGPRRRGPLLLNKKNCRASMICITICISFCFHLCKMAKPKMQWRLRWFWNTARFRARRRGISNDPGHLHILSGERAYIPRWRDRIERVTLPCACIQFEAWRGLGRIRRVFAISCQLSNMTWSRVVWGRRQMRTLRSLAILEKELIASLSWLLIRPQSPSG